MSAQNNSRPQPQQRAPGAPVIVRKEDDRPNDLKRLLPAALMSAVFHVVLLGLLFLFGTASQAEQPVEENQTAMQAEPIDEKPSNDPFLTSDVDPAGQEFDTDIQYMVQRKEEISVPGQVNPNEPVGIEGASKDNPPTNLPAPGGFGNTGQGGAPESNIANAVVSNAPGQIGGYGLRGMPLAGTFYGRSGSTREYALRNGGGTKESEACVTRGLQWLMRVQSPDGKWSIQGPFKDQGTHNDDVAGTAFGLLPLLGAGKTHKAKDAPYDKPIEKALWFLIRKQNKQTGALSNGMYAHGLATIAMSEAFGLSQDPNLKRPAQMAVNYIINAQHEAGGWRYGPKQAGDTSVVGWQVMALKSAQMAGLEVPDHVMKKAIRYLDDVCDSGNEGYGYTAKGSSPTMSAVGLLCRQYLQSWGPQNIRMITGIDKHVKNHPPSLANMYYSYYATQVMHHFGGQAWKDWNSRMRDMLVKSQDKVGAESGSWNPKGAGHAAAGGRLMQTSLCLLTLEVYYRHLPLYYREAGNQKEGMFK